MPPAKSPGSPMCRRAPRSRCITMPSPTIRAKLLEALRDAGHDPRLVDVAATPPTRDELKRLSLLLREADQSLVRRFDPLFLELQLDDRFISESEFWQGIAEHPQLINAPVVVMANKARLARGADDVRSFLGQDVPPPPKPKGARTPHGGDDELTSGAAAAAQAKKKPKETKKTVSLAPVPRGRGRDRAVPPRKKRPRLSLARRRGRQAG